MEYEIYIGEGAEAGVVSDVERMRDKALLPVQTHTCNVAVVERDGTYPDLTDTDALISLCPDLRIGVRTADCVPVLLYAPDIRAVAAIHAGWRGTLGGIVTATIERLIGMGAHPEQMQAAFGPSICGECYEVDTALTEKFREAGFGEAIIKPRHIDLERANTLQLQSAGIPSSQIRPGGCCTLQTPDFPSWRRTTTQARLLTHIILR